MKAEELRVKPTLQQNIWYFISVSVKKINHQQSIVCILAAEIWTCQVLNALYSDTITSNFEIGGGFSGIIRKLKIF